MYFQCPKFQVKFQQSLESLQINKRTIFFKKSKAPPPETMNEEMNRDRHFSFCADRGRAKIIISVIDHTTTLAFDK